MKGQIIVHMEICRRCSNSSYKNDSVHTMVANHEKKVYNKGCCRYMTTAFLSWEREKVSLSQIVEKRLR